MIKNNKDARTVRTQTLLKNAMVEQLSEKRLHEITVSSLCRASQINRVTFYDHYKDVFDLADAIENDIIRELQDTFQRLALEGADSYSVSDSMFEFLDSHRSVMLLLLKGEAASSFRKKFNEATFPFFEAQLKDRYGITMDGKQADLLNIMHYITSGYEYFFIKYLENPGMDYHAISVLCTELSTQALLTRYGK